MAVPESTISDENIEEQQTDMKEVKNLKVYQPEITPSFISTVFDPAATTGGTTTTK